MPAQGFEKVTTHWNFVVSPQTGIGQLIETCPPATFRLHSESNTNQPQTYFWTVSSPRLSKPSAGNPCDQERGAAWSLAAMQVDIK
jgi:hypothetical protein